MSDLTELSHRVSEAEGPSILRKVFLCFFCQCQTFKQQSDETGCWGECTKCGKRSGFVSREALQEYSTAEELAKTRQELALWKENAIECGKMLQSFTPGGSEYFGKRIGEDHFATDAKACGAIIRAKLDALHQARCDLARSRAALLAIHERNKSDDHR